MNSYYSKMSEPHPVFQQFLRQSWSPITHNCDGDVNFLGVHIPLRFDALRFQDEYWSGRSSKHWPGDPTLPSPIHEDYFEYVDLLESISRARGSYKIVEVGAGYGRWILNAANAIRRYKGPRLEPYFIGFEADQERAEFFRELMGINSITKESYSLIEKIVVSRESSEKTSHLPFIINKNDPSKFGGAIVNDERDSESGRLPISQEDWVKIKSLPVCSFEDTCIGFGEIDFMNFDIQNAEIDLIPNSIDYLTENVRLCHVGTHSHLADKVVQETFQRAGWYARWEFRWKSKLLSDHGALCFRDGVFSYENPRLMNL